MSEDSGINKPLKFDGTEAEYFPFIITHLPGSKCVYCQADDIATSLDCYQTDSLLGSWTFRRKFLWPSTAVFTQQSPLWRFSRLPPMPKSQMPARESGRQICDGKRRCLGAADNSRPISERVWRQGRTLGVDAPTLHWADGGRSWGGLLLSLHFAPYVGCQDRVCSLIYLGCWNTKFAASRPVVCLSFFPCFSC